MAGAYAQALLVRAGRVLLVKHTTGMYAGRWTGLIAPCVEGEPTVAAAARAALQVGFTVPESALRLRAVLQFDDRSCGEEYTESVFVSHESSLSEGEATPTAQLEPAWHPIEALPSNMPADDEHWYSAALSDRRGLVRGRFVYDTDNKLVVASVEMTEDTDGSR
jgi:hypothetical protein